MAGHRVVDGSQGMALLLNLVSFGLSPVAPEVAVVVVCDARMTISHGLAVLERLHEQGDYCPPFIPITDAQRAIATTGAGGSRQAGPY